MFNKFKMQAKLRSAHVKSQLSRLSFYKDCRRSARNGIGGYWLRVMDRGGDLPAEGDGLGSDDLT